MIQLKGLTLRRGARVLFDAVQLTLHPGEKAALVGRNGAGKSSLFALLLGHLHEDAGDWSMPAGCAGHARHRRRCHAVRDGR
jgi:ATP-binding cassette subfamily F protein 3